jgi:D-alanyl-D-alanine carboxypeptidase
LKKHRYLKRIGAVHASLGIDCKYGQIHSLPVHMEVRKLVSIGPDIFQREQFLAPPAAKAWHAMREGASTDGVILQLVSAFRSVHYQEEIIRRKLEKGLSVADILRVSAAPGYSEHHTGRAVDLTAPGAAVLEEEFEESEAFGWLKAHAGRFGFHMSFPRGNPHGVAYEPWHWAWRA